MKAGNFDYIAPDRIQQVSELLGDSSCESRIIAGGQTLVPMLAMRVAQPARLIDISKVDGLDKIESSPGGVLVPAMVRQAALEDWLLRSSVHPVLQAVIPWIAHRVIRNRGTVCGSIAHADPSAELPLALVALQGRIRAVGLTGSREIEAEEFFLGALKTALNPTEFILSVNFPYLSAKTNFGFQEFGYRSGDFAVVSVLVLREPGQWIFCLGGIDDTPRRFTLTDATEQQAIDFLNTLVSDITVREDPTATSEFRRHLIKSLGIKAIYQTSKNS